MIFIVCFQVTSPSFLSVFKYFEFVRVRSYMCYIQNAVFCEESFGENSALCAHLKYKDVDHFQNRLVHELHCLKACQVCKVHARSHDSK